jgi:hypothetical protein
VGGRQASLSPVTGPARNSLTDDAARWAEAQSILDRTPTGSAEARLRRARRNRWLLIVGFVLVSIAVGILVAALVIDPRPDLHEDVPVWRSVTGFTISGLALVFMATGLVIQYRRLWRARAWGSPMYVLTRRQRKELLRQVRGQEPVAPERIPLARHLAELLLLQGLALSVQAALMASFVGLWIADGRTYRLVFIGIFAVVLPWAGIVFRREHRRARRFLETHPDPRL